MKNLDQLRVEWLEKTEITNRYFKSRDYENFLKSQKISHAAFEEYKKLLHQAVYEN